MIGGDDVIACHALTDDVGSPALMMGYVSTDNVNCLKFLVDCFDLHYHVNYCDAIYGLLEEN